MINFIFADVCLFTFTGAIACESQAPRDLPWLEAHRPFVPQGKQECLSHLKRTSCDIALNDFMARLTEGRGETAAVLLGVRWRLNRAADSAGAAVPGLLPSLFVEGGLAVGRSRLLFLCSGCCQSRKYFPRVLPRVRRAWPKARVLPRSRDSCSVRSWGLRGRR